MGWIIWLILFGFMYWYTCTDPQFKYIPRKKFWMVTDGHNHWVEGRLNADGIPMTYEEIMEEDTKNG